MIAVPEAGSTIDRHPVVQVRAPMMILFWNKEMAWWNPSPILICLPASEDRGSTVTLPAPGVAGLLPATYRLVLSLVPIVAASTPTGCPSVRVLMSRTETLAWVPPHSGPEFRM